MILESILFNDRPIPHLLSTHKEKGSRDIFVIFEEMKLLSKYLFVLLILPMWVMGQQQVIIRTVNEIKWGFDYKREENTKSTNPYYPIQFLKPYYFDDSCISFYKERRVSKIEALDTFGKSVFTLFLNKAGTLTSANSVDRDIAFKEVFEPSFYSRTSVILNANLFEIKEFFEPSFDSRNSVILNTPAKLNDSFVSKIFTYKNADTTITFYQNTTYTYKTGQQINARNYWYNDIYMRMNNRYLYKVQTPYRLDGKMKRLLAVNYEPQKLYKCSEKRFCNWIMTTKNNRILGDQDKEYLFYHPFGREFHVQDCIDWFVDGENLHKPVNSELLFEELHPKGHGNYDENYDLIAAKRRAEYTFEVYTQNESGLNDTAFLYYYPMASEDELRDCLYFEGKDPKKRGEISPGRDTEKMRSLIPKRIPLFTIRYEYFRD